MKKALINYVQNPKNDELYTPRYAIEPLMKYIPSDFKVWEPTDFGYSEITKAFLENGNDVVSSHINEGHSFFDYEPDDYDVIVTNPPYSIKDDFLERAYSLQKPFAFLLPLTSLEGVRRGKMFREYGISIIVLDRRVNFMTEKKSVWFNTSWFCWGIDLPSQMVFEHIEPK